MKSSASSIWNVPNLLSLLRMLLVPVFVATVLYLPGNRAWVYLIPAAVFGLTALTDMLDGKIARRYGLITDFGKFLDPIADKMLTTAAFLGFIALGIGDGIVWVTFIVLLREFMVSSVRLVAASSGGKVIAANIWGKVKTVFQMIAIIFALTARQFVEIINIPAVAKFFGGEAVIANIDFALSVATTVLIWVSAVLCVLSGVIYLVDNKQFFKNTK